MFKLNKMHVLTGVAFSIIAVSSGWAQITEPVQNFPSKPITVVVTFPPGGGTDILARLLGNHFTEAFGQSAIVENRAGASGNVGAKYVTEKAPDGYSPVDG